MIVTNNKNTINGSNALVPQHIPSKHTEKQKYRDLEKLKREHIKINKQKSINKKAKVLRNILILFAIGITLVYRYSLIYNMEKEIINVKKEIASVNADNENIRIGLLKYSNIEVIEKNANSKLNMIPKSRMNVIYIDLDKNNFKDTDKEGENKSDSVISKLKKILY